MKPFLKSLRVLAATVLLAAAVDLAAQPVQAAETRVNITTAGYQYARGVATSPSGQSVVIYETASQSGSRLYAQIYDSSGAPVGDEKLVTTNFASGADVAMDASGNFVVTWTAYSDYGWMDYDVLARYFSNGGASGTFQASSSSEDEPGSLQMNPSVGMDSAGNFTIAWEDDLDGWEGEEYDNDIYMRRFRAGGSPIYLSDEPVKATVGNQYSPDVAMNASGDLVVSYWSDRNTRGIAVMRYNNSGFGETQVSAGNDSYSRIAIDDAGNFIVAFNNAGTGKTDAQRFNRNGVAQGGNFQISPSPYADVAMDASGNFVATYSYASDGSNFDVYAQRYRSDGTAKGTELRINTTTAGNQSGPRIALDDVGRFIVAWTSNQNGTDTDVYADRFLFNNAPVAKNQFESILEDTSITIDLSAFDRDRDALTYTIVSQPTKGTLSGSGTKFTYTPNPNAFGSDSFTYKANDGTSDSNVAKISLAIAGVNDAPVARSQSTSLRTNSSVYITLLASDVDNASLTYSIVSGPTNGTLSGSGSVRLYTPTRGYVGDDSFTFQANDGTLSSNVAKVSITVRPNMAPIADSQFIALKEDTPTQITLSAKDGDDNTLAYTVLTQPTKGTLTGSGQNFVYTPNANVSGSDSFTFKVSDGNLDSNVAKITLAIQAVNDAPVAQSQSVTTTANRAVSIPLRATDVDNAALTYSIASQPQNGSVTLSGNTARYTPNAGFSGSDSFSYKANDGSLDSNAAPVSINVQ